MAFVRQRDFNWFSMLVNIALLRSSEDSGGE
jgi:hypothetical protein